VSRFTCNHSTLKFSKPKSGTYQSNKSACDFTIYLYITSQELNQNLTNSPPPLPPEKKNNSYNCKSEFREEIMTIHLERLEVFETDILTEVSIMAIKMTVDQ